MKNFFRIVLIFLGINVIVCKAQFNDSIPKHITLTISSKILKENRVINVWLPHLYNENKDSYPVIYMLDGGIKEDFPHLANTIADLIQKKKIKPIILVGIENTQRRRDLTGFTDNEKDKEIAPIVGGSLFFREFINQELFKEINSQFRVNNSKSIIGESLAGLFITETFLLTPTMFDNYIAFDPSLWWNNAYLLQNADKLLSKFNLSNKQFWFTSSNTNDISEKVQQLSEILKYKNIAGLKYNYSYQPKEQHSTIFRATKENALVWTFGRKETIN